MATLDDIRQLFFTECEEQLEQLTDGLTTIEGLAQGVAPDPETINTMFRAVHSIKGGAAAFSLKAITRYAHAFESVLDEVRSGALDLDAPLTRAFYGAVDYLSELVTMGAGGDEPDEASLVAHVAAMAACSQPDVAAAPAMMAVPLDADMFAAFTPLALDFDLVLPTPEGFVITFRPTAALFSNGHEPARLFSELEQLGTLTVEARLDPEMAWDAPNPGIDWTLTLITTCNDTQIREIFEFAEPFATLTITPQGDAAAGGPPVILPDPPATDVPIAQPAGRADPVTPPEKAHSPKATVRIDLDLVDNLINMVGELVITQSVMTQSIIDSGLAATTQMSTTLDEFKSLTRHIQEGVMAIRAQSVKPLFQRMGRIVRETAQIAGKTVRFVTVGEDTEVDRTVVERLVDPLTHILRNAIDHGLEMPSIRQAAGKEPDGTVFLSAAHRSGRVVIEVRDNGGGVDRDKVLASAIRKGLVPATAALGSAEIDRLLFLPGFSTAETVTSLSGRGVGMDVVNNEIKRLGGRVTITSTPGEGTTILISLPLTLAVLDGMVVDIAGQTMVVPISAIVETICPDPSHMNIVGPGTRMITVRGKTIPVIDLAAMLGFEPSVPPDGKTVLMLVQDDNGECRALAIDRIMDQRQVVIKSLEGNYGHVPFIAAATILGDGQIALILDLEEIIHRKSPQPLKVSA